MVLGTIPIPGRDPLALAERGYGIVIGDCDMAAVRDGAVADIARHRKAFPGRR